jgi:tRNA1(Val) A37 N6-methylase TrmN6
VAPTRRSLQTIEAQEESIRLAKKSAAYNGLIHRYEIRYGISARTRLGRRSGLILGSLPYFPVGWARKPSTEGGAPLGSRGHQRLRRRSRRTPAPGGVFACAFPEDQLGRAERAAADANLTIVRRRPVIFREGDPPLIDLFAMMRAADLPSHMRDRTWTEPALVVRCADGSVNPEYAAVKLAVGFPP